MYAKNPLVKAVSIIPVLLVGALFTFEGYCYNYIYILDVLGPSGNVGFVRAVGAAFNAVWLLALWSFLRCTFSDPGVVPEEWHAFNRELPNEPVRARGGWDWQPKVATPCRPCGAKRPERAHHCSVCGRCVMRMDHHCPWVGNCVGFKNHKFFILMGFYGTAACAIFTASAFQQLQAIFFSYPHLHTGSRFNNQLLSASTLVAASFGVSLGGLFVAHVVLALQNRTTLEIGYSSPNPYHLGWLRNFEQLFGPFNYTWFLPVSVARPLSDGCSYPVQASPQVAYPTQSEIDSVADWDSESQTIGHSSSS